jgi:tungstate transport system ATP-binding protein
MRPVVSLNNILVTQGDSFKLSVGRLALQPGLIYALTGANGSGKSTLLRVMALLTLPFKGTIEFSGNKTNNLAQQRQKVTLVEQSPYLFKGKVIDNLNYGLKLRGIDSNERSRRIKTTLTNVGLEGFEQRQAKELSGGEIQRVALARALALKPELLLLDEPTANIDSSSLQGYESLLLRLEKGRLLISPQQRLDERSNLYGT